MSEPLWIPLGAAPAPPATSAWVTGDTKVSMQTATHDDPAGGKWLLADGSAIPGTYTALIALCGANLPDARGRGLYMKGTHADVDAIGDSDGVAVASRTPKHKHTLNWSDPGHSHATPIWTVGGGAYARQQLALDYAGSQYSTSPAGTGISASVGPQASGMLDNEPYVVVGNLFVHT